ncbi:Uncharacterised protein [Mycobacteroides abscessus subsp. abscessus]|nr:Uncharacterised protein [Mycobacteroides abscessus subsp. abscessus]
MTVFVALIFLLVALSVALAVMVKRIDRNTVYDAGHAALRRGATDGSSV